VAVTLHTVEVAHPAARVWALFVDPQQAAAVLPRVEAAEVLAPGDAHGNGRVRALTHRLPLGRRGTTVEVVGEVAHGRGFTYRVLGGRPGADTRGRVALEPTGPTSCRLRTEADAPTVGRVRGWWDRLLGGAVDPYDPRSVAVALRWLDDHPAFRADLAA